MTDEEFQSLVVGAVGKGVTIKEFSGEFEVSIPTVKRWIDGTNSPAPTMIKYVVEFLDKRLGRKNDK